ncbi:M3 family peptidase [Allofranklinella schreckenbergeri]|uniref:oligopeptidase A n=1 Tax=Allofranklinella schreckenbergeri TaxID=1076744 RepID=A0A3M6QCM7_9BURK|nr:M3 family metallopeptidase [Allofranklinella schreckenbergeri]RMX00645.1 M3 family peptidase [Allofranklinella schreckenbergeri]
MTSANPLLSITDLPAFDQIRPEHVGPAIAALLADADAALTTVTAPDFPADWLALSKVLDVATERLSKSWGVINHLSGVADSPELRQAYNEALPLVTAFWTRLGASEALFAKYQQIDPANLNAEQRRALELALRGFVLSGAQLQGAQRERFAQIQERLAALQQKFSENVLDATDAYHYDATAEEVRGLPGDVLQATAAAAQAAGVPERHRLTLKMPVYLPVLQYAQDRALRERLFHANAIRASDLAPAEQQHLDNSAVIDEILRLRAEEAQLLGYPDYAELSLAPKMANSGAQVVEFLRDLARRARPYAEKDAADLRAYAREHLQLDDPQPWDWTFISEKLKEARYSFSDQEIKPYFQAPKVIEGLFAIVQKLFNVTILPDQAPVWHPAVQFFRIERDGQLIGQFYLDQPARAGKRGGAWMDDMRGRWLRPDTGQLQTPVAYLVCNFAAGAQGQPALLTHDDVITLFHEFGHGLHHMLTQVNERDVSGISGVEWDAVELPSQFMENFCWEWPVLQDMTAHIETGEPLPRALYDKMLAAKNYQSGMQTLRQVEFALFDMLLHQAPEPQVLPLLAQVRAEVSVLPAAPYSRTPHAFSHIFAGGYAAGYYSYKWAEVLSADAYAAFEEEAPEPGRASPQTGQRYLHCILEAGGSRPAMESFKAFRGREPELDALLRHQGMAEPA